MASSGIYFSPALIPNIVCFGGKFLDETFKATLLIAHISAWSFHTTSRGLFARHQRLLSSQMSGLINEVNKGQLQHRLKKLLNINTETKAQLV